MEHDIIKKILRETFLIENKNKKNKKNKKSAEYARIKRALDDTLLTQSQVMAAADLGDADNASHRSLFSKKVNRYKNPDTGSVYQFNQDELAKVTKVISNPPAFYV